MKKNKLDSLLSLEQSEKELENELEQKVTDEKKNTFSFDLTPRALYDKLCKSVIGQEEAKQKLSNAVCYHYKSISENKKNDKYKNNVLLIGPTGCGKTYIVQKIAQALDIPLLIADATVFSGTGYVGEQVNSLVQDLVLKAEGDVNIASKGIIYLDEIDKIAAQQTSGRDVSGKDVQSGLLKIIEAGSEIKVILPEGERLIKTDNILFIAGGAFSELYQTLKSSSDADVSKKSDLDDGDFLQKCETPYLLKALKKFGMIPELLGRIPVISKLKSLTNDELKEIMIKSDDSITKRYQQDFKSYGINITFTDCAYEIIAQKAYERKMGARGLGAVVEEALTPLKFHAPGTGITEVEITEKNILNPLATTLELIKEYKNKLGRE